MARTVDWFSTGAPGLVSADRHATYAVLTLTGDAQQRTEWAPAPLRRFQERFGLHEAPDQGSFGTLDAPAQAPGNRRDVAGVVQ